MPGVRIEWLPGRSDATKQALADRITQAFHEICGIKPEVLDIIFQTVDRGDWFVGGQSYASRPVPGVTPEPE